MDKKVEHGYKVVDICNNESKKLETLYNEAAEKLKELLAEKAEIEKEIHTFQDEVIPQINAKEVCNVLDYVRSYKSNLSGYEIDVLLCHCQNKLHGNLNKTFLIFNDPTPPAEENKSENKN